MTENLTDSSADIPPMEQPLPGAPEAVAAPRRRAARRAPKLDDVLAAAVDRARTGVLEIAPAEQIGEHVGSFADGDRLVTHRFEAKLAGYAGWQWYATLARIPRGKEATVCEVGLLPSDQSLLAPEWVPWADRVRPEEVAVEDAAGEAPSTESSVEEAADVVDAEAGESEETDRTSDDAEAAEHRADDADAGATKESAATNS